MTEREMKQRKAAARKARQRKARNRRVVMTVALMLVVCVASVGGTIAWLQADTTPVVNTFSPTNITLNLVEETPSEEDRDDIELVPGLDIEKDPKVSATSDVPYYVFVKVTEENWPNAVETDGTTLKVKYGIANGWTLLEKGDNDPEINGVTANDKVYYKAQTDGDDVEGASVLADDKVYVSENLTKKEMANITAPKLTFAAYAIQMAKSNTENFSAIEAWNQLNPANDNAGSPEADPVG